MAFGDTRIGYTVVSESGSNTMNPEIDARNKATSEQQIYGCCIL